MCGIFGIINKRGVPVREDVLLSIAPLLRHRGPDNTGIFRDGCLGLLHTRLKIVDLSDAANQPFSDGEHVLVFNGEIFNHNDLRRELAAQHAFTTTSDTEVLFAALRAWGTGALDKVNGQFAFAFYTVREKSLLLARDHVGICPLYCIETDEMLAFSSEIRPLLAVLGPRAIDPQGVMDYFAYRYTIQNGRTLFDGIRKFPPAHARLISVHEPERSSARAYWRLSPSFGTTDDQEHLNLLLSREIKQQLAADVPVGLFLSGGIDSAAILHGVSLAGATEGDGTQAFTLRMAGEADQDVRAARRLHRHYDFCLHETAYPDNASQRLPQVLSCLEDPFGDVIVCANDLLARQAAERVKVVLSGEGGDEAFFGYDHQRAFAKLLRFNRLPGWRHMARWGVKSAPSALLERLSGYAGGYGAAEKTHLARVLTALPDPGQAYINLVQLFAPRELQRLFNPAFLAHAPAEADTAPLRQIFMEEAHPVHASLRAEVEQLTLPLNLMKQDRLCMQQSLEARVPLVSKAILEHAARLPLRALCGKPVKGSLQAYAGMPRRAKQAFSMLSLPSHQQQMMRLWRTYITPETIEKHGILDRTRVSEYENALHGGSLLGMKRAMAILVFVVWIEKFHTHIRGI